MHGEIEVMRVERLEHALVDVLPQLMAARDFLSGVAGAAGHGPTEGVYQGQTATFAVKRGK